MAELNKRIFLSPPHMGGQELEFVKQAFESNYIAPLGPQVDAFEREFSEIVGIQHAVAVSSGTAAMHLALPILSIRLGIRCPATSKYKNEEEILAAQVDPEKYNREVIFPDKVRLNREYVENYSFIKDMKYIFQTIAS
jgi:cystathionine beta-lyase/cystathionine gamma-synthase